MFSPDSARPPTSRLTRNADISNEDSIFYATASISRSSSMTPAASALSRTSRASRTRSVILGITDYLCRPRPSRRAAARADTGTAPASLQLRTVPREGREERLGINLPKAGISRAGNVFMPPTRTRALRDRRCSRMCAEEGQTLLGCAIVPTDNRMRSQRGRAQRSCARFIGRCSIASRRASASSSASST